MVADKLVYRIINERQLLPRLRLTATERQQEKKSKRATSSTVKGQTKKTQGPKGNRTLVAN